MHKYLKILIVCGGILLVACNSGKATLQIEKTTFAPGEGIKVAFTAPAAYSENAWIGIIPSDIPHGSEAQNDDHDIGYRFLEKQTSGVIEFSAPGKPGSYDFRMHDTDENGKEVASISFKVELVIEGAGLEINKTVFAPGEEIRLTFTAPEDFGPSAWVGIIPSDVPHGSEDENDAHDLAYQYLEKKTQGLLVFTAPESPGKYDFRMHDTDNMGNEITYIEFTVE